MGLAIDHPVALLNDRTADGLREMALAGPWWTEKERVLALPDESSGGELVDERAIDLLVEIKIEAVERAIGIAKARLLVAALEEAILPAEQLVVTCPL